MAFRTPDLSDDGHGEARLVTGDDGEAGAVKKRKTTNLTLIDKLAYAVSYVEGLFLFDLETLSGLPPELSAASLAGATTGQIPRGIDRHIGMVSDSAVVRYLETSWSALYELSDLRNHMLHARPATSG